MMNFVALILFMGIIGLIVGLYIRRKKIEGEMSDFYTTHSLYRTTDEPPNVRESLNAGNDNLYCCRANLRNAKGENVEFCWWEWYLKSNTMINGVPTVSFANYLAVSFAAHSVSDGFINKALLLADKSADSAAQKVKDFFVTDRENPYRAEILADGSLIICWQVLNRRDIYEAKIEWLKNNVAPLVVPEIIALEKVQNVTPDETKAIELIPPEESKIIEIAAPDESKITPPNESKISGTIFYTHDSYAMLRHKFNSAWANLDLELHHSSAKFQHEGYDEFDSGATFGDANSPNEIAFALTDETIARTAMQLFSEHYGGEAYILRDGISIEDRESLGYCNNPFRLPLNEFTYGEFKRRFSERWTNLSIELYETPPHEVGAPHKSGELATDFEMKRLKNAEKAFLHDYLYISDWNDKLVYIRLAAAIKNNRFGIYSQDNYRRMRLKEFNEAESSESLRRMSIH